MKSFLRSLCLTLVFLAVFVGPMVLFADTTGIGDPGTIGSGGSGGSTIPNPLGTIDGQRVDDITSFVVLILKSIVLPIGVIIVVFFVIYSGFLFVTARGNADKIADARKTFLWVVVGAAILLGSVVIASAIQNTVCAIAPSVCSGGGIPQGSSILPPP